MKQFMENLESIYEDVITEIQEYYKFTSSTINRKNMFRVYVWLLKHFDRIIKEGYTGFGQISGKQSMIVQQLLEEIMTEEQKSSHFYTIMRSDYPIDALSCHLTNKYPNTDFNTISQLHKYRSQSLVAQVSGSKAIISFVFASGFLILQSVPQSVVESFGWVYSEFQKVVFWSTMIFIGYLLLFVGPLWYKSSRARETHERLSEVIEYTRIRQSIEEPLSTHDD